MSWVGPTFDPLSTRPTRPVLFLFVPVITTMSSTTTELRWARVEINIEETESNQILEDKNFPNKFFCSCPGGSYNYSPLFPINSRCRNDSAKSLVTVSFGFPRLVWHTETNLLLIKVVKLSKHRKYEKIWTMHDNIKFCLKMKNV